MPEGICLNSEAINLLLFHNLIVLFSNRAHPAAQVQSSFLYKRRSWGDDRHFFYKYLVELIFVSRRGPVYLHILLNPHSYHHVRGNCSLQQNLDKDNKHPFWTGLKLENYYFFTFTFSRPEVRKLLLFYVFTFSRPEVRKLFRIYVFTFSRPEVRKLFRIYVFTFSRPEVRKLFRIYFFTFSRPEVRKLFRIYVFTFSRLWSWKSIPYFDGVVQDCSNSSELLIHWSYCSIALRLRNME